MRKRTKDEFIKTAKEVHGDKYDYSLVDYKNDKTKVKIICKEHGVFEQKPNNHLWGKKCDKCGGTATLNTEEFIKRAKEVHCDRYDYSLVDYKGIHQKVKIICKEHGVFEQDPASHIIGSGCSKCSGNKRLNTEEFIKRAKEVHGDKYDYSLVEYKLNKISVQIICKEHGVFEQKPNNHLSGQGCLKCRSSKGENFIRDFLINKNIHFESQKRFAKCREKRVLAFDFYLPKYNICIEYDGRQHYKPVCFGGISNERAKNNFELSKKKDQIKNDFCKQNNIYLLRISFKEPNIQKVLEEKIWQNNTNH